MFGRSLVLTVSSLLVSVILGMGLGVLLIAVNPLRSYVTVPGGAEEFQRSSGISQIIRDLQDEDARTRLVAAGRLQDVIDCDMAGVLCRIFLSSKENAVRISIGLVLPRLGARQALPMLWACAQDPDQDWDVRRTAIMAVGELGGKESVPLVSRLLTDKYAAIKLAAIYSLGQLGDSSVVPLITPFLNPKSTETDKDNYSYEAEAAEALGKLGDIRAIPHLLRLAESSSAPERVPHYRIGVALMRLKCKEGIPLYLRYAGGDFLVDLPVLETLLGRLPVEKKTYDIEGAELHRDLAKWWDKNGEALQWDAVRDVFVIRD